MHSSLNSTPDGNPRIVPLPPPRLSAKPSTGMIKAVEPQTPAGRGRLNRPPSIPKLTEDSAQVHDPCNKKCSNPHVYPQVAVALGFKPSKSAFSPLSGQRDGVYVDSPPSPSLPTPKSLWSSALNPKQVSAAAPAKKEEKEKEKSKTFRLPKAPTTEVVGQPKIALPASFGAKKGSRWAKLAVLTPAKVRKKVQARFEKIIATEVAGTRSSLNIEDTSVSVEVRVYMCEGRKTKSANVVVLIEYPLMRSSKGSRSWLTSGSSLDQPCRRSCL